MDKQYITNRFINTCLRENVYSLLSTGVIVEWPLDPAKLAKLPNFPHTLTNHRFWLKVVGTDQTNWLPVQPSDYMQYWQLTCPTWVQKGREGLIILSDYQDFIALLKQLPDASHDSLDSYLLELDCATEHRALARQGFESQRNYLAQDIKQFADWSERLLYADQVASYLDHPYYPTARAKLGLTNSDIKLYSPEFAPTFELHWVAVPNHLITVSAELPSIWPSFEEVGLETRLKQSHQLFPVHPLTIPLLKDNIATSDTPPIIFAPQSAVRVKPTLSVRTVVCCDDASIHIKVPLIARTLGNKNIRLIKPSTIYDGYWFQQTLQTIEQNDVAIRGLYYHCDEAIGGHVGDDKSLAFIIRRYDTAKLVNKTPVPVAAFGSAMPDGRPFISHLIDQYYDGDSKRWLTDYIHLLCCVHLQLWIKYGIALESNQQNAVILFDQQDQNMTLLMKDNDAARILPSRLNEAVQQCNLSEHIDTTQIKDQRILVDDEMALAQMFLTITIQLDIAAIIEMMSDHKLIERQLAYRTLAITINAILESLMQQGFNTQLARQVLLKEKDWDIKYLLCAGSLLSKAQSGATDINKFYGHSAPNTLALMQQDQDC